MAINLMTRELYVMPKSSFYQNLIILYLHVNERKWWEFVRLDWNWLYSITLKKLWMYLSTKQKTKMRKKKVEFQFDLIEWNHFEWCLCIIEIPENKFKSNIKLSWKTWWNTKMKGTDWHFIDVRVLVLVHVRALVCILLLVFGFRK